MSLAVRLRAARRSLREMGTGTTVLYALHRLLPRVSGGRLQLFAYGLYAQPLGQGLLDAVRDDPQTVVAAVHTGTPLAAAFPRPPAVIAERFARGAQCHAATLRGEFAGYIWIARGHYDEDEVRCRYELPADGRSVWDFDVHVEPRLRLGRTMARLWKAVDAALAAEGVRWTFSRISLFNRASLQSHARLGARRCGSVVFVQAGALQLACSTAPLRCQMSWGRASAARLRLRPPGVTPV